MQAHPFPHRKYLSVWKGYRLQKGGERPNCFEVRLGHLNIRSGSWWLVGLKDARVNCPHFLLSKGLQAFSLGSLTNSGLCVEQWLPLLASLYFIVVGYVLGMQTAPGQCLDNCTCLLTSPLPPVPSPETLAPSPHDIKELKLLNMA